jgi:hypothetical protein
MASKNVVQKCCQAIPIEVVKNICPITQNDLEHQIMEV